jgi:hypothetical protein
VTAFLVANPEADTELDADTADEPCLTMRPDADVLDAAEIDTEALLVADDVAVVLVDALVEHAASIQVVTPYKPLP